MDPVACNFNPDALVGRRVLSPRRARFFIDHPPRQLPMGKPIGDLWTVLAFLLPTAALTQTRAPLWSRTSVRATDCYTFTIFDAFGDGILGAGGYALTLGLYRHRFG